MYLLDLGCTSVREAFKTSVWLVGSALKDSKYRDVDVRLVLMDADYDGLTVAQWALFNIAMSSHLSALSGLPVDFQVQQQTASERFEGMKQPLGVRRLENFGGDAVPTEEEH
jgi:hypothetical protein